MGGSISLAGVFISSYALKLKVFLFFYCVVYGLGSGMCNIAILIFAWEWFPKKKGFITGLLLGAYGFGSFVFILVSTKLVNPDGENATHKDNGFNYFDKDVADRVPYMLRTLVYIWSGMVLAAVIMIFRKGEGKLEAYRSSIIVSSSGESTISNIELEPEEQIRSARYSLYSIRTWQLMCMFVCGQIFTSFFSYSFYLYG